MLSAMVLLSGLALVLNSCKKETPDTETNSALDNNICETEFTKMMPRVNNFGINEQGVRSVTSGCPTVISPDTVAVPGWPRTLTIDYGTTGCLDTLDNKVRKGQIVCEFSNRWHLVGSSVKVTLVNFSVDGVSISCDSMKFIHSAANAFTTKVFNGKCVSPSWSLDWACDRTLTQTAGMGDTDPYNDVFSLMGTANGKNRDGKAYSVNIPSSSPLVKRSSCSWIESGILELTPDGLDKRTVDFGNGTCDKKATLIINGNSFNFDMN